MITRLKIAIVFGLAALALQGCIFEGSSGDKLPGQDGASYGAQAFQGHCTKYLKVSTTPKRSVDKVDDTPEGSTKSANKADATSTQVVLLINYDIKEQQDGSRYVYCSIDDGIHQYQNQNQIPASQGYMTENLCDITYSLDGAPTFGTFTFSYATDWAWIAYDDDETQYHFDTKFRLSECVALSN